MTEAWGSWIRIRVWIQILLGAIMLALGLSPGLGVPSLLQPKSGYSSSNPKVVFAGKAPPGSIVVITANGQFLGRIQAEDNGNWRIEEFLEVGKFDIRAELESDRGQRGRPSEPIQITITDFLKELERNITITSADNGSTVPRGPWILAGNGPPGARLEIAINGKKFRTVVSEEGQWRSNLDMEPGRARIVVRNMAGSQRVTLTVTVR